MAMPPPSEGARAASSNGTGTVHKQSANNGSGPAGAGANVSAREPKSGLLEPRNSEAPPPQTEAAAERKDGILHLQSARPADASAGASHLTAPQSGVSTAEQSPGSASASSRGSLKEATGWLGPGAARAEAPAEGSTSDGARQAQPGDVQPWGGGTSERLGSLGELTRRRHEDAAAGAPPAPRTLGRCPILLAHLVRLRKSCWTLPWRQLCSSTEILKNGPLRVPASVGSSAPACCQAARRIARTRCTLDPALQPMPKSRGRVLEAFSHLIRHATSD